MRKNNRNTIAALSLLALGLSACSADNGESADAAAVVETSSECTVEDAPLRVYTNAWGPDMTDKFTEDTGIEVELADLGGGEILARIAAEQNNPQWDVVLIDGHGSVEAMNQQDQLLTCYELENINALSAEAQELLPEDRPSARRRMPNGAPYPPSDSSSVSPSAIGMITGTARAVMATAVKVPSTRRAKCGSTAMIAAANNGSKTKAPRLISTRLMRKPARHQYQDGLPGGV